MDTARLKPLDVTQRASTSQNNPESPFNWMKFQSKNWSEEELANVKQCSCNTEKLAECHASQLIISHTLQQVKLLFLKFYLWFLLPQTTALHSHMEVKLA